MWILPGLEIVPYSNRNHRIVGELSEQARIDLKRARWLRYKRRHPERVKASTKRQNERRKEIKRLWTIANRARINAQLRAWRAKKRALRKS